MNVPFLYRGQIESLPGGTWVAQAVKKAIDAIASTWDNQHLDDGTHGAMTATSASAPLVHVGTTTLAPIIFSGKGSPEGVVLASVGSMYLRTDGGAGTSFYVKETGAGQTRTGWVAK